MPTQVKYKRGTFALFVYFLLACAILTSASTAKAESISGLSIKVVSLGLAKVEDRGSVTAMELLAEPGEAPTITQETGEMPRVPALLDHQFGYRFQLNGPREGANWLLHFVAHHPEMKAPKKADPIHMHTYDAGMTVGETRFNGFKFTQEYELAPGIWTFEIYEQDNLLHTMKFEVYKP